MSRHRIGGNMTNTEASCILADKEIQEIADAAMAAFEVGRKGLCSIISVRKCILGRDELSQRFVIICQTGLATESNESVVVNQNIFEASLTSGEFFDKLIGHLLPMLKPFPQSRCVRDEIVDSLVLFRGFEPRIDDHGGANALAEAA
jgi:hypothetical protein